MIKRETVFGLNNGKGLSFRIPALEMLPDGTLCAFCEARQGTGGDWDPMSLQMRRRTPDGKWQPPVDVAYNAHGPAHNPGPFVVNDELHLLYGMDYARFYHTVSRDGGLTFSEPEDITYVFESFRRRSVPGGMDWHCIAVGPGGISQLDSGRIVVPVWLGGLKDPHKHDPCQTAIIYSDDCGKTWQTGDVLDMFELGPSEAQTAALPCDAPARAVISLRNHGDARRRGFAWSPDGVHWSKPELSADVTEINCQGALMRMGRLLVTTGPEPRGDALRKRARQRLTLRLSRDWGRTWPRSMVLETGAAGYSALAADAQGRLLCLYETWEDPHVMRLELLTVSHDELDRL